MIKIDVNLNDKSSIQNAINKLKESSKEILDQVCYETPLNSFDLPYITLDGKDIKQVQFNETNIIQKVMDCEYIKVKDVCENTSNENFHNIMAIYSQCYLVLKALENGFEQEVMEFANTIVEFSIKHNESDRMWYNGYNVYGFDILRTMAYFDEKYFYLLYRLVTPNWDEEHCDRMNQYLHMDMENITRAKLKALAYGSNYYAVYCNFLAYNEEYEQISNGKLYPYFKANPEEYKYFKEELFASLRQTPRNEYISFYIIAGEKLDEILGEEFIDGRTYEEERDFTDKQIQEILAQFTLNDFPFEQKDEEEEDDEYYSFSHEELEILGDYEGFDEEADVDTLAMNKEFLLSFEHGEEFISYIQNGKNEEILQKIQKVADLRQYAQEKNLNILKRFIYDGYDLDTVLEAFMYEQNAIKENEDDVLGRVLRVINILLRICKEKMKYDHVRYYTSKYKLCSLEEFKRINKDFMYSK